MAQRITQSMLEGVVNRINQAAGTPAEPYTKKGGKLVSNVGNYHLDGAYGGWKLVQMTNEMGGITVISSGGYISKRDLYNQLHTILNWIYNN